MNLSRIKDYLKKGMAGFLAGVLLAFSTGCALPDELALPESIVQPVEQAVSSVKQNIELREKMNALQLPKEIESISTGKYAYETLSEEDKIVYDQMLDAINGHEEEVTLSILEGKHLEAIYECIKADYGGLFWVENFRYTQYQRNGQTQALAFSPSYSMTLEERNKMQAKIDQRVKPYLKGIDADTSDYEKALLIYRRLIRKVDYDLAAEDNQNIISVFINKKTVCQGYANATQYLLNLLDIPCIVVTGTANGGSHAWNMAKLDGEWYYLDTTWGNSTYHDEEENSVKYVEYDYLNITSKELLGDHRPQTGFELPDCTATADNYYVQEGRYFTNMDETTIAALGSIFQRSYEKGTRNVSVKFSDRTLCTQAKEYFLTDYHIRDYCPGLDMVYYNTDSKMNVFTIIFP